MAPGTVKAMAFGPVCVLLNTSIKAGKLLLNERRYRVLDSSFLLLGVFAQHSLHNSDLGALAAVDICCEIEKLSILSGAGSVK